MLYAEEFDKVMSNLDVYKSISVIGMCVVEFSTKILAIKSFIHMFTEADPRDKSDMV